MTRRAPFKPRVHAAVMQRATRAYIDMLVPPEKRERFEADFQESTLMPLPRKRGPSAVAKERRDAIAGMPGVDIDAAHKEYPLERKVLADVLQALRNDPRVAIVDRRQSGVFQEGDRMIRVGTRGVLDVSGMLVGGRYFEIECKRHGKKPDERQQARIDHILHSGGISGFATSAAEALALLP